MVRNLEALRIALPLATSRERFAAPENRERLERALAALSTSGKDLATHTKGSEVGFARLGSYFADRTASLERRFRAGELDESRFLLWTLADTCMDCHERLPSGDSHLGSRLVDTKALATLPPEDRVRLEVASRQFTTALDTYEAMFRDPAIPPTKLDLADHLTDYLLVAVRVVQDPGRAQRAIDGLRARSDVSRYLVGQLGAWSAALGRLAARPAPTDQIAGAQALLAEAAAEARYPADRRVLVQAIAASGLLDRYVAAHPAPSSDTARAYLLLARAEQLIRRSFGASLTEAHLEAAIRMAPGSAIAAEAYDVLEENTIASFEGSAGLSLPADERARLDRLRAIAEGR